MKANYLLVLIITVSLIVFGCTEDSVTTDTEGFNTITPIPAPDYGDTNIGESAPTGSGSNCRSDRSVPCTIPAEDDTLTVVEVENPWTLDLQSGKFCSFVGATSNSSYFSQNSEVAAEDTVIYGQGGNSHGEITGTPSSDPMGLTVMDMREPTTQISGGDSGVFALQNKTKGKFEGSSFIFRHAPAVNVQMFGSYVGEGEYMLKNHQNSFDEKYGKSSWKVSAGHRATYILTNTGYLLSSGDNSWGQQVNEYSYDDIGGEFVHAENIESDKNFPFQTTADENRAFKNVLDMSAGSYHICMLHGKRDVGGTLWCKGKSNRGQALYDGTTSTANQYKEALKTMTLEEKSKVNEVNWHKYKEIDDGVLIASGYNHTCTLRKDATVWCHGSNERYQLGQQFLDHSGVPLPVYKEDGSPLYAKFVYASRNSTYAISVLGELYSWGSNDFGKLGVKTVNVGEDTYIPQRIGEDSDWTDVASYNHHVVATQGMNKERRYFAWGDNSKKQVNTSEELLFVEPVEIFLPANPNF